MNFGVKILKEKYFHLAENHAVVTWSLCDDVTTKHFLANIWFFKANKKPELALQMIFNMWQTVGPVKL